MQDLLQDAVSDIGRMPVDKNSLADRDGNMGANIELIRKYTKSKVYTKDGKRLRKDVMSKTLIRLLKRFVMNAYEAEILVI